jgi:predicted ATP-binding protein involved in virulence
MDDDDTQDYVSSRQTAMNKEYNYKRNIRNETLEEVAQAFDAMKNFGDTSASFAVYIRSMKSNAKT